MLNYNVKSVINTVGQYTLRMADKYNIQRKLGSCTFVQVKYAVNKQTKHKAAIKYISLKKSSASMFIQHVLYFQTLITTTTKLVVVLD